MSKGKSIQLFSKTNLALEALRLAIEVQLGEEINFRTITIDTPHEESVCMMGNLTFSLRSTPGGMAPIYRVEIDQAFLAVQCDIVVAERAIFSIAAPNQKEGNYYYAHAMYSTAPVRGINFPTHMRVTLRRSSGPGLWRFGSSAQDSKEYPLLGAESIASMWMYRR